MLSQAVFDQLATFGLPESVKDAEQDASHHDAGDGDDAHRQTEGFEIGKQLFDAAIFTKFASVVKQFYSAKIGAPFVIERTVSSAAMYHPEAATVNFDAMSGHWCIRRNSEIGLFPNGPEDPSCKSTGIILFASESTRQETARRTTSGCGE